MISRPISEWTLSDLQSLGSSRIPESQRLEFKSDFEQGEQERWRTRQDQISSKSRDALAEEIVAFANAFGGVLLLGILEERQDDGTRVSTGLGEVIPRVAECADRLESGLRDVIDPPLAMLEVKAIKRGDDDAGYLIIKIPASLSAPHGVGRPARGFVRRGASCEPMTMRDLQHTFWEARTAIDRVNSIFSLRSEHFRQDTLARDLGVPPPNAFVSYRFTIVPARSYAIPHLPSVFGNREFQVANVPFSSRQPDMLAYPSPRWRPAARAMIADDENRKLTIWTDGTIELSGKHTATVGGGRHYPAWYAAGGIWCLYNAVRLRRHFGHVDVPLLVECELQPSRRRAVTFCAGDPFPDEVNAAAEPALTDRLELGTELEFDAVAQLFAEQIGWACGLDIDFSTMRLGSNLRAG